ncbi:hypothetical protein [Nocardia sp. NPDC051832]|uniref:hypothetical protein n=1 Tax=Nocardia sp. NPDC051832 TaxID=3155673 RepID=UPI003433615D
MRSRHYCAALASALTCTALMFAGGPAQAQPPPRPGQACSVEGATTRDAQGRTMWCNPMMTGTRDLVWQLRPATG